MGCVTYINKYQKIAMDFIDKYPLTLFMDCKQIDYETSLVKDDVDINVTLIESDAERCVELAEALPDADIICGDAGSQPLLASEGLESADALVTLTGNDELNAIVSLYDSSCQLPLVITRLDRLDNAKIIYTGELKEWCCSKCKTLEKTALMN